jgi:Glyoxalase-like domain
MSTELDHIFIMCEVEAPEVAALTRIGLVEGPANVHPGQGTACRRFSFPRQYFELLWVRDRAEAQSETTAPTRLWARWSARRRGACPFGLVFRPGAEAVARPPFPTWSYTPSYLSGGLAIEIAVDTPIAEPEFLFLPFLRSGADALRGPRHAIPVTEITHVRVGTPSGALVSSAARWARSTGLLSCEQSNEFVLTVTFDRSAGGHTADLRPDLPLVLRW